MGHAGAIVSGGAGTAQEKMARFERAGVPVAKIPSEIPGLIAAALAARGRTKLRVVRGAGRAKPDAVPSRTKKAASVKKAASAKKASSPKKTGGPKMAGSTRKATRAASRGSRKRR